MRNLFKYTLLFTTAALMAACSAETSEPATGDNAAAPTSLREANIPADFTFATTRPVTFQVENRLSSAQPVEIRNPRGELLVRSNLPAGQKLATDFPLPLGDSEVLVKLGDQEKKVAVVNNTLTVTFE